MDNSQSRLHDVFFYGLYMDPELLRSKGVEPRNPRTGMVLGYKLHIGNMATLLRHRGSVTNGIVYSLTHNELETLYAKSGLDMYIPEAIQVVLPEGIQLAALTCTLLTPPDPSEHNQEYKEKLLDCMTTLDVPTIGIV